MKSYILIIYLTFCFCVGYAQNNVPDVCKWRLNVSGGIGYYTANTSNDEKVLKNMGYDEKKVKHLFQDYKTGILGNVDFHYLLNENIGLGIRYAFFTTSGSLNQDFNNLPASMGISVMPGFKATDYIHFAGPSLHARLLIGTRWIFSFCLSGGYAYYRGEFEEISNVFSLLPYTHIPFRALTTGHAFGFSGGLGLEYFLNRRIALGLGIDYSHLSLSNLKVKTNMEWINQDLKDIINGENYDYSRLEFSLGVKIYF